MRVCVHVKPGSRREVLDRLENGDFRVTVKEEARGNRANLRVQQMIAEHFNVPVTSVRFQSGGRSKKKVFDVVQ